jgi:hypothetical protein
VYTQTSLFSHQSVYASLIADAEHRSTEHLEVLGLLFDKARRLKNSDLLIVMQLFMSDMWRVSLDEFENTCPIVKALLDNSGKK